MSIHEAILVALYRHEKGDRFSLLDLTREVSRLRGRVTTDGSVSRRLREYNEGKYDFIAEFIFRWKVAGYGVYEITRFDWNKLIID